MLNLAPPSDGSYDVECISYQTFQDATITQGANVTFEVNSSSTDDKVRFFELTKNLSKHARLIIVWLDHQNCIFALTQKVYVEVVDF